MAKINLQILLTVLLLLFSFQTGCAETAKQIPVSSEPVELLDQAWTLLQKYKPNSLDDKNAKAHSLKELGNVYAKHLQREKSIAVFKEYEKLKPHQPYTISAEKRADDIIAYSKSHGGKHPIGEEEWETYENKKFIEIKLAEAQKQTDPERKLYIQQEAVKKMLELEMWDEAANVLDQYPTDCDSYPLYAFIQTCELRDGYEKSGQKEKAEATQKKCETIFELVQKSDPDSPGIFWNLLKLKKYDEAIKRRKETDPEEEIPTHVFKDILLEKAKAKQYGEALELAEEIEFIEHQRDSELARIYVEIATIQIAYGDHRQAFDTLDRISEKDRTVYQSESILNLYRDVIQANIKEKDSPLVKETFSRMETLMKSNWHDISPLWNSNCVIIYAETLCTLGKNEEAITILQNAQREIPEWMEKDSQEDGSETEFAKNFFKSGLLLEFAEAKFACGDQEGAKANTDEALALAKQIYLEENDEFARMFLVGGLTRCIDFYAKAGFHEQAFAVLNFIEEKEYQAFILIRLAQIYDAS